MTMGNENRPLVVVLGGSGMLGAMVVDVLSRAADFRVAASVRDRQAIDRLAPIYSGVEWRVLDAQTAGEEAIAAAISGAAWVVNCIGIIKPYIHDDNAMEVERALRVNALFPHLLGKVAAAARARVIQIATDCVYSGVKGRSTEATPHDPLDVYGKTKSLGEAHFPGMHYLRCSIIGPEPKAFVSLLEWFLGRPRGAQINGYANHHWNGVTTLHFARLCQGIISRDVQLPRMQHVVPSGLVTKAEMLSMFADAYDRHDIRITPTQASTVIDRTLATDAPQVNADLWRAAGYEVPPTVPQMIEEMSAFGCRWRAQTR
jgi:dTDP-4-dehydrorhamnose reductase